jgi:hypothetical protein
LSALTLDDVSDEGSTYFKGDLEIDEPTNNAAYHFASAFLAHRRAKLATDVSKQGDANQTRPCRPTTMSSPPDDPPNVPTLGSRQS